MAQPNLSSNTGALKYDYKDEKQVYYPLGNFRGNFTKIFKQIRILMMNASEKISKFSGEIVIDESYFGAKRVRGKRSRGVSGKTPVFGMLKRVTTYFKRV